LYWRLLRLRHVRPNSWQRAAFFEGSLAVAAVLVLADLASAWLLIALPVAVALVVKAHDVFVGWLRPDRASSTTSEAMFGGMSKPADDIVAYIKGDPEPDAPVEPEPAPSGRVLPAPAERRPVRARPGAVAARAQATSRRLRGHGHDR
jgi:hypothetical protein